MQGNLLSTITFPEFTDLIRREFVETQQMVPYVAKQLFITEPVSKGQGNSKSFTEIDTETYARLKREGVNVKKAKFGVGYTKLMYKKRIGIEIDITQEMRDENRYTEVGTLMTDLAHFCPQRIELDLTHRFTFANATSYVDMDGDTVDITGGDGLSIVNAAHTLKYSSLTWNNRVPGDPLFARGPIEAAELLTTTDILSNFGERRVIKFNTIISGDDPTTTNEIKQFLESTTDVDQNNPGVKNMYYRKYKHVELPYLATTATGGNDSTKRRWWGIQAAGLGAKGLQAYYGEWEAPHMVTMPTAGNNMEDGHADIWSYGTRAGYGIVIVSGRGLIMSMPTS